MKFQAAVFVALTLALTGCKADTTVPYPSDNPSITVGKDRLANYKLKIRQIHDCETLSREYDKQDTGDDPQRDAKMEFVEDKLEYYNCFEENHEN